KLRQERHQPTADAAPLGLKTQIAHFAINITPLRGLGMATTTKSVSASNFQIENCRHQSYSPHCRGAARSRILAVYRETPSNSKDHTKERSRGQTFRDRLDTRFRSAVHSIDSAADS